MSNWLQNSEYQHNKKEQDEAAFVKNRAEKLSFLDKKMSEIKTMCKKANSIRKTTHGFEIECDKYYFESKQNKIVERSETYGGYSGEGTSTRYYTETLTHRYWIKFDYENSEYRVSTNLGVKKYQFNFKTLNKFEEKDFDCLIEALAMHNNQKLLLFMEILSNEFREEISLEEEKNKNKNKKQSFWKRLFTLFNH